MVAEDDILKTPVLILLDKIRDEPDFADEVNKAFAETRDFRAALKKAYFDSTTLVDYDIKLAQVYLESQSKKRSEHDLLKLVREARYQGEFAMSLSSDFKKIANFKTTLRNNGYFLDEKSEKVAIEYVDLITSPWRKNREQNQKVIGDTLDKAAKTYNDIGWMTRIMFSTGIFLFLFAVLWSVVTNQAVYSLAFGGLGAADFIALFLYKPMEKREQALSDLVQSIIIFMNHNHQTEICDMLTYKANYLKQYDLTLLRESGRLLQEATAQNAELCQKYLEPTSVPISPKAPLTAPILTSATPGSGQVVLEWKAPTSDGGSAITGYKVYQGTVPGGEKLIKTLENVLTHTDMNLTNGQTYYYKVSAVNSVGEGPHSKEILATPNLPKGDKG